MEAQGFSARVIQHEVDHLSGILFVDQMPDLTTLAFLPEYQKYWEKEKETEG